MVLSLVWTLVALVAAALLPLLEAGPIIAVMMRWGLGGVHQQATVRQQQQVVASSSVAKEGITVDVSAFGDAKHQNVMHGSD